MSIQVKVLGLRVEKELVQGLVFSSEEAHNLTISQLATQLANTFPLFARKSFLPDGTFQPYMQVLINGQNIRHAQGTDTVVPEGAKVIFFASIGGG